MGVCGRAIFQCYDLCLVMLVRRFLAPALPAPYFEWKEVMDLDALSVFDAPLGRSEHVYLWLPFTAPLST